MSTDTIQPGLVGEQVTTVTPELTARHLGSGGVDVYATPAMISLMEYASVAAIDHLLPEGHATVGTAVDVRHLAATPIGMRVRAQATLTEVGGRRLTFAVEAHDEVEKVGEGLHTRVVVDVERFVQRVEAKKRRET